MVVGRISIEKIELFGVLCAAVLGDPELGNLEILVTQHVKEGHGTDYRAEQVRALSDHSAHQQATIGAALDGEMVLVRVFC